MYPNITASIDGENIQDSMDSKAYIIKSTRKAYQNNPDQGIVAGSIADSHRRAAVDVSKSGTENVSISPSKTSRRDTVRSEKTTTLKQL